MNFRDDFQSCRRKTYTPASLRTFSRTKSCSSYPSVPFDKGRPLVPSAITHATSATTTAGPIAESQSSSAETEAHAAAAGPQKRYDGGGRFRNTILNSGRGGRRSGRVSGSLGGKNS